MANRKPTCSIPRASKQRVSVFSNRLHTWRRNELEGTLDIFFLCYLSFFLSALFLSSFIINETVPLSLKIVFLKRKGWPFGAAPCYLKEMYLLYLKSKLLEFRSTINLRTRRKACRWSTRRF